MEVAEIRFCQAQGELTLTPAPPPSVPLPVTSHETHDDAEPPEEQQTHFRRCWQEAQ